jgi:hypothetical protein
MLGTRDIVVNSSALGLRGSPSRQEKDISPTRRLYFRQTRKGHEYYIKILILLVQCHQRKNFFVREWVTDVETGIHHVAVGKPFLWPLFSLSRKGR